MSPDDRRAWEDDTRVPSDFMGVHPVKLAPDAPQGIAAGEQDPMRGAERDPLHVEVEQLRNETVLLSGEIEALRGSQPPQPFVDRWQFTREARRAETAERERDEALAEVERLREKVQQARIETMLAYDLCSRRCAALRRWKEKAA